jgi:hypothetical protein
VIKPYISLDEKSVSVREICQDYVVRTTIILLESSRDKDQCDQNGAPWFLEDVFCDQKLLREQWEISGPTWGKEVTCNTSLEECVTVGSHFLKQEVRIKQINVSRC